MICISLGHMKQFCIDGNGDMNITDDTDPNNKVTINLGRAAEFRLDAIITNMNRLRHHCVEDPDDNG